MPSFRTFGLQPGEDVSNSPIEVLLIFLRLGCTSFGGPIAHLGFFRAEFVERRRWIDERGYSDLVALCQFMPGPASSQLAVAVVAQAVWGMARNLAPDAPRATLAVAAALLVLAVPSAAGQIGAIGLGAFAGLAVLPRPATQRSPPASTRTGAGSCA